MEGHWLAVTLVAGCRKGDRGDTGAKDAGEVRQDCPLTHQPIAIVRRPGLDPGLGFFGYRHY